MKSTFAYSHLAGAIDKLCEPPGPEKGGEKLTIHDPCTTRFDDAIHLSVRMIITSVAKVVEEMTHSRKNCLCCGEGGGVGLLDPAKAKDWQELRWKEAGGLPVVTYCAGCTMSLGTGQTHHLLDLIFPDQKKSLKPVRPPRTYLNRLFFKWKIMQHFRK